MLVPHLCWLYLRASPAAAAAASIGRELYSVKLALCGAVLAASCKSVVSIDNIAGIRNPVGASAAACQ
jgi:hypothetical protein